MTIFTFSEISLKKLQSRSEWIDNDPLERFIDSVKESSHKFTGGTRVDFENYERLYDLIAFESDSLDSTANLFHKNYLHYLERCWANHLGIVITPDIIWYTILSEVSSIVSANSEAFRYLFTTSTAKKKLVVSAGGNEMPLSELTRLLKTEVPIDTSMFFPGFNFTKNSQYAFLAAFCDLCSPYYDYSMLLCGFPFIRVEGSIEDWKLLREHWVKVRDTLKTSNLLHIEWKRNVDIVLDSILSRFNDASFWNQVFSFKKCGSGHQKVVSGWLLDLYVSQPDVKYAQNYASHISNIKYNNIQTEQHYEMNVGLFNSTQIDEFMVPSFSSVIFNMTKSIELQTLIAMTNTEK